MNDADLFNRFALVSSVASGAVTAGLGLLLFAPKSWVGRAAAAAAAVAVTSGLTALLAADVLGWVAGGSAVMAVVCVLASTAAVRQLVGRCARPRVIGGAALLAAFGVWGYEAWRFDAGTESLTDQTLSMAQMTSPTTKPVATAATDRGGVVDLNAPVAALSDRELASIEVSDPMTRHASHVIRRGKATDESNCHGWVFTGGRYNVGGRFVDTILTDNGYTGVADPAAGDLCVYRGTDGEVAHTSVVRAVLSDGTVLVEGKWGRLGVYLHDANESCYGTAFGYYHTARVGHLLTGIDGGSTVETASEHP